MPSSTKWRIYITAVPANTRASLTEIAMRAEWGGPNLCVGGTPIASGYYEPQFNNNWHPSKAFDGSASTAWQGAAGVMPCWIGYEFATPQSICELALNSAMSSNACPSSFELQYWDGAAWVATIKRIAEPVWGTETRIYNQRPKMDWRVLCEGTNINYTGFAEVQFRTAISGPDVCTGGIILATRFFNSSFVPANAFDDVNTTAWLADIGPGYPHYIRYSFPTPKEITEYALLAYQDGPQFAPTNFRLQFNDGAGGWTDADVRTGVAWTTAQRTYAFTPIATIDPPAGGGGGSTIAIRPQVFVCT